MAAVHELRGGGPPRELHHGVAARRGAARRRRRRVTARSGGPRRPDRSAARHAAGARCDGGLLRGDHRSARARGGDQGHHHLPRVRRHAARSDVARAAAVVPRRRDRSRGEHAGSADHRQDLRRARARGAVRVLGGRLHRGGAAGRVGSGWAARARGLPDDPVATTSPRAPRTAASSSARACCATTSRRPRRAW